MDNNISLISTNLTAFDIHERQTYTKKYTSRLHQQVAFWVVAREGTVGPLAKREAVSKVTSFFWDGSRMCNSCVETGRWGVSANTFSLEKPQVTYWAHKTLKSQMIPDKLMSAWTMGKYLREETVTKCITVLEDDLSMGLYISEARSKHTSTMWTIWISS